MGTPIAISTALGLFMSAISFYAAPQLNKIGGGLAYPLIVFSCVGFLGGVCVLGIVILTIYGENTGKINVEKDIIF